MARVRVLRLLPCPAVGDAAFEWLVGSPHARSPDEIDVRPGPLTPRAAERLAGWPGLPTVRRLDVYGCGLGERDEAVIRGSPFAGRLGHLAVTRPADDG